MLEPFGVEGRGYVEDTLARGVADAGGRFATPQACAVAVERIGKLLWSRWGRCDCLLMIR